MKNCLFCRQPIADKSETAPLFPSSPGPISSPTAPNIATGTMNRTLLHHHNNTGSGGHHHGGGGGGGGNTIGSGQRNGTATRLTGLAHLPLPPIPTTSSGDSPPPGYDVVVHGTRHGFF